MPRAEFTPRGTQNRFLIPAVIHRQDGHGLVNQQAIEPHRYAAACLTLLHGHARVVRGAHGVASAAFKTLPRLSKVTCARFVARLEAFQAALAALPEPERMPVLLATAYALHESSPVTQAWKDVGTAIGAAQEYEKIVLTDEHEEKAAWMVKELIA